MEGSIIPSFYILPQARDKRNYRTKTSHPLSEKNKNIRDKVENLVLWVNKIETDPILDASLMWYITTKTYKQCEYAP